MMGWVGSGMNFCGLGARKWTHVHLLYTVAGHTLWDISSIYIFLFTGTARNSGTLVWQVQNVYRAFLPGRKHQNTTTVEWIPTTSNLSHRICENL